MARAGSMPPISSQTTSMPGSSTIETPSVVKASRGERARRGRRSGSRTATRATSTRQPARTRDVVGVLVQQADRPRPPRCRSPASPPGSCVRSCLAPRLLGVVPEPGRHQYLVLVTVGLARVPREPALLDEAEPAVQRDRADVVRVDREDDLVDAAPSAPIATASAMRAVPTPRPRDSAATAIPSVATCLVTGCSSRWMYRCPTPSRRRRPRRSAPRGRSRAGGTAAGTRGRSS